VAEIRKHNPTTSDIGQQVRALLGETIRPVAPGQLSADDDDMFDPFAADDADPAPSEAGDQLVEFTAGGGPLIGSLPEGFNPWVYDDDPAA